MHRHSIAILLLAALSACGGSGNGQKVNPTPTVFEQLRASAEDTSFDSGAFRATPFDDLPSSGSASYDGVAVIKRQGEFGPTVVWDGEDPSLVARVNLTANFRRSDVAGRIDRFYEVSTGDRLPGALILEGALADRAGGVIQGNITGQVETPLGEARGGSFTGNFTDEIDGVSGALNIGADVGSWEGLFEATRN